MPLSAGTRLGPYDVVRAIGAGGMGEVYKATDTRLDREVAIKVLPAAFAEDADRVARFEREAKAVAALSHPNIVSIFDTGVQDGRVFVVMELLAGQTLRERLSSFSGAASALPVRKAVDAAAQIARGLGAAHGKGIVHRDLKPENIFLLEDGQVKILDFGLARQTSAPDHSGATQTGAATDPGTVMGTVGYMAPEQVRGQVVDARADLFAFGALLYEMVSGQRAFQRDTAADTMTAILTQEPPELMGSRPDLSPALDRIIRHCLEKHANERFQSARDIAFALEALSGTATSHPSGAVPVSIVTPARRWLWPAALVTAVVAACAGGMFFERSRRPEPARIQYETKTWDSQWITNARFGPDGQTIIFSAARMGNMPSLYTIRPGGVTPQLIGEPGTHLLAVSPKGKLAVLSGARFIHHRIFAGTLSRMTMDGAARPWLEHVSEADYSPDGSTLAAIRNVNERWQLEYPIGKVLYVAETGYISDPRVSPDGTRVAFFDHPVIGDDRGSLKVVDASGHARALTGEYWGEEGIAWSRDSQTVFFTPADSNTQFDVATVNATGTPRVRQAAAGPGTAWVADIAADGRLLLNRAELRLTIRALVPGDPADRDFPWLDFSLAPFLSRDGRRLAFGDLSQSAGADYAVALRELPGDKVVRLGPGLCVGISPDAKWGVGFIPSAQKIVLYPTGPGDPVFLERPRIDLAGVEWFSDSTRVLYCGRETSKPFRCYTQDIKGGAPAVVTPDDVTRAIMSPDDRTLLIKRTSGVFQMMTIGGAAPVDARGFLANDTLLSWTSDRTGVIVTDKGQLPLLIDRVDPLTGRRTRVTSIVLPDRTGVIEAQDVQWLPDGHGYAYAYQRELAQLFVVSGVQR